jgi:hypothetical protein
MNIVEKNGKGLQKIQYSVKYSVLSPNLEHSELADKGFEAHFHYVSLHTYFITQLAGKKAEGEQKITYV